jgi:hypothetical protein
LSNREIMDFDLLTGKKAPFLGFGETIQDSREIDRERRKATDHAREQIRNVFPFHKAFKCLIRSHGETMTFFVIGLGQVLEEYGLVLKPEMKARLPKPRFSSEAK